jgi:hypothetical protein
VKVFTILILRSRVVRVQSVCRGCERGVSTDEGPSMAIVVRDAPPESALLTMRGRQYRRG